MATSSGRTPPPFPEEDLDIETRDEENIENDQVVTLEDVTEVETQTNSVPEENTSGFQTGNVSNPITESKSDIDVLEKQGEQSIDMESKEESCKLRTPQNTAVSKPENYDKTPPSDQTDSAMQTLSANDHVTELFSDPPVKALDECELETVNDSANDMSHLNGEPINDCKDNQDKPVVDVILEPKNADSDSSKTLSVCDQTEDDSTNALTQETEKKRFGEPVNDCQSIPLVDGLTSRSADSDCPGQTSAECKPERVSDSTNDPFQEMEDAELYKQVSDSPDIPVVDVPMPSSADSHSAGQTLTEFELEADNDPTGDLSQEIESDDLDVSNSKDIPVVDVLMPSSADSHSTGQTLAECKSKTGGDPTGTLSQEMENDELDVSDSQDMPVVDVHKPDSADKHSPGQISSECELEGDSGPTGEPSQEMESDKLHESDSKDISVVDVIPEKRNVDSNMKFDEFELKIDNEPSESQDIENNQISEPVSHCQDLPVGDVLFEPRGAIGEPLRNLNSFVCVKDPLSNITEHPSSDNFPKLLSEPANKLTDLFSDQPDDLFSEMLNDKFEQQGSVCASSTDTCLEGKNVLIAGPLSDDLVNSPSDCVGEVTSPTANSDSSSESLKRDDDDDEQDIFSEATVELSLDSPAIERKNIKTPRLLPSASIVSAPSSMSEQRNKTVEEVEEEDQFELNVSVTNPEKVGDGINAYMAYRVSTQTTLPVFKSKSFVVRRRFSDFLGLYEKLSEKLSQNGYIVPPPPEKSILGMTKVKVGKEDHSSAEFLEKRRAALERFIQRILCHPLLLQDPDVREFLEREELPRAVNTQTLSSAGLLKFLNRATEAVSKMTIKMNESDIWFEEKLQEVEGEDQQLRKLHIMVDLLANHRKDLSAHTAMFARSIGMLGSSEDSTALSRALCQLAEVEEKIEQLHQQQAGNDFFNFAELLADYIRLLGAVRGCFDQRMKMWQRWQDAQNMLQKKREAEAKLLWANKPEKLQLAKDEIAEWEAKVTQYERDFERISATVRKEVIWFEKEKAKDFKKQMLKYLQALLHSQQQMTQYWESFLPEAKAIA